jgi:hypothetical protein
LFRLFSKSLALELALSCLKFLLCFIFLYCNYLCDCFTRIVHSTFFSQFTKVGLNRNWAKTTKIKKKLSYFSLQYLCFFIFFSLLDFLIFDYHNNNYSHKKEEYKERKASWLVELESKSKYNDESLLKRIEFKFVISKAQVAMLII